MAPSQWSKVVAGIVGLLRMAVLVAVYLHLIWVLGALHLYEISVLEMVCLF